MNRPDTPTNCHCGASYGGSDHCPECYCEQYESGDCGHDRRPTYVQRLDAERRRAKAELSGLEAGLRDLRVYLCSEKFWQDRSVNVEDVLLRLDEARNAGLAASGSV